MELAGKHPIWNRAFLVLELACIPLALWWLPYPHLPPPGWAVAFIAGAAAAMSVHDDMKGWQKGLWMLLIGAFLITELRAINKDRTDNQTQAINDRKEQDKQFQSVREQQDKDFQSTAQGLKDSYIQSQKQFDSTMGGLSNTLKTIKIVLANAEAARKNTEPFAKVVLINVGTSLPDSSGMMAPPKFTAGVPFTVNFSYRNAGTEGASDVWMFLALYVAKPDDVDAQNSLSKQFDEDWKLRKIKLTNSVLPAGAMQFSTSQNNFLFLPSVVGEFKSGEKTVYLFFRIEYTDEHGEWYSDYCAGYQNPSEGNGIMHPCLINTKQRYSTTQH